MTLSMAEHVLKGTALALCAAAALVWPLQAIAQDEAKIALGKQLFTGKAQPACAICHTLAAAGAEGQVGPVLDEIKPDAERVKRAVKNGLGLMPPYSGKLSEAEIEAVAAFVSTAAGGAASK